MDFRRSGADAGNYSDSDVSSLCGGDTGSVHEHMFSPRPINGGGVSSSLLSSTNPADFDRRRKKKQELLDEVNFRGTNFLCLSKPNFRR